MPKHYLHNGDCLEALATLQPNCIDAVVTDPPYHLTQASRGGSPRKNDPKSPFGRHHIGEKGFMGKTWDGGDVAFRPETWAEILRVAKPGAHLLAFGGTRTWHRLACAIEDAGWEIRDTLMWVYGSGFPKSLNLDGDWEGWGTALKLAWEPIIVARKPLEGTVATNVQRWGTGAINIDACRVETQDNLNGGAYSGGMRVPVVGETRSTKGAGMYGAEGRLDPENFEQPIGRWPANVVHDGSEEVLAAFPESKEQQGRVGPEHGPKLSINTYGNYGPRQNFEPRGDTGSAARFFKSCVHEEIELLYCRAKAILSAWNQDLANSVDNHTSLSNQVVVSVLSHVVTAASLGAKALNDASELSTNVTPRELKTLVESLIVAILSTEKSVWHVQQHEKFLPNGSRVNCVEVENQTGTTLITIDHWKSDGSAAVVTFNITLLNSVLGVKDSKESRIIYCAKSSKADRGKGNGRTRRSNLKHSCAGSYASSPRPAASFSIRSWAQAPPVSRLYTKVLTSWASTKTQRPTKLPRSASPAL